MRGARLRARFYGAEIAVETDPDGYFRVEMAPGSAVPRDRVWHQLEIELVAPTRLTATADVYIPPAAARFVVVSDIDDTVMVTGVVNKAAMLWRLFVQDAEDRTVFPGVSHLYRALHAGASGAEGNPMIYVSRAPWGLYDVLESFFQRHDIPVGPILFLREWGVGWRHPLPRRATDHKRILIDAVMALYDRLPVVLIGDSGQHDPEVYGRIVAHHPGRVLAVYIRDVTAARARARRRGRRTRRDAPGRRRPPRPRRRQPRHRRGRCPPRPHRAGRPRRRRGPRRGAAPRRGRRVARFPTGRNGR